MPNNTISQVKVNGTTYDICDATNRDATSDLETRVRSLENSVDLVTGTTITNTVANGVLTNVRTLTVTPGIWIFNSAGNWKNSFNSIITLVFQRTNPNTIIGYLRNNGSNGGDFNCTVIKQIDSNWQVVISIRQDTGASQDISWLVFQALKIK